MGTSLPAATQAQDGMAALFVRGLPAGASAFAALDVANNQANDLLKVLWRDQVADFAGLGKVAHLDERAAIFE